VRIAGLSEKEWASIALVAFAGGFSERFFLKSLARVTGLDETPEPRQPRADDATS
jgi:hypothetical protein